MKNADSWAFENEVLGRIFGPKGHNDRMDKHTYEVSL